MKLFLKKDFVTILSTYDKAVKLGWFKLGTSTGEFPINSSLGETLDENFTESYCELQDIGRSPTNGYYEYDYLFKDKEDTLQISFNPPDTDLGVRSTLERGYYTVFYGFYSDYEEPDVKKLGFVLFPDYSAEDGLFVIEDKFQMDHNINIFNIPLKHNCMIVPGVTGDTEFLEGTGHTEYHNIYKKNTKDDGTPSEVYSKYVSVESYDDFLLDLKSEDQYIHHNAYLNKFGIKIY